MKNKKIIIIFSSILLGIILLGVILYFVLRPKYNLSDAFDYMTNLDSYKVVVNKISEYDTSYYDEDEIEEEVELENIIEKDVEKITDTFGTRYFYNDKIVESEEYGDGEIWYYEREWMFSSVTPSFKSVYDEMFNILNKYKFSQKKNVFQFVNEKYIDEDGDEWEKIWDLEEELEDIIDSLTNGYSYEYVTVSPENGVYNVVSALGDVSITLDKDKIDSVTLIFIVECYDEEDEWLECSEIEEAREIYKLVIDFSDYGITKVDFPKNFESDLQKTTAGNWVGKYEGTITCPDGKTYEETMELHDSVKIDGKIFWDVDYKVFGCESGYYSQSSAYYTHENNKIVLYDFFREEVLTEFELSENKLIEKDETGNVLSEFKKGS